MGKYGPSPPDPVATANAQSQQNRDAVQASSQLNAVNVYGPWGSTTYDFGDKGGMKDVPVAQHTNLTPTGQQIFDNQQNVALDLSGRAITALNNAPTTPYTTAGMPYDPRSYNTNAMPMYSATSYGRNQSIPSGQGSVWGSGPTPFSSPTGPGGAAPPQGQPPQQSAAPWSTDPTRSMPGRGGLPPHITGGMTFQAGGSSRPTGTYADQLGIDPALRQPTSLDPAFRASQAGGANGNTGIVPPEMGGSPTNGGGVWNLPGSSTQGGDVLPYDPRSYNVTDIDRGAQATSFNETMRNLSPQFDLQTQRLENDLHNRGIPIGSKAWMQATGDLQRNQNNATIGAANQAYAQGHQFAGDTISREQGLRSTAFNEGLTTHKQAQSDFSQRLQTEQNLRNTALNEAERQRMSAINDASIYLQGAPAMQMPQAPNVPTYQIAAPDLMGATYNSANLAQQQAQARNQSTASGLGSAAQAGTMLWMLSSAVLKEDIGEASEFLDAVRRLTVRSWRYTPEVAAATGADTDLHVGPLAEDFAREFGGPGTRIHMGDALFSLWKAVQELADRVDRLVGGTDVSASGSSI